jgi:uncharacterized membrane protein
MATNFNTAVDINASPQRIWSVMSDLEHWHEWTRSITSVKRLDSGPLAVGSKAVVTQPKLSPAEFTVTALEEDKGFTWETRSPGAVVVADHRIDVTNGGCRVTLSLKFSGLVGPSAAFMMRQTINEYLEMEAAGLKMRCEAL